MNFLPNSLPNKTKRGFRRAVELIQREITDPVEKERILAAHGLDIMLAEVLDEETGFVAAHGSRESAIALRDRSSTISVWILEGPKSDRKGAAEAIRVALRNLEP